MSVDTSVCAGCGEALSAVYVRGHKAGCTIADPSAALRTAIVPGPEADALIAQRVFCFDVAKHRISGTYYSRDHHIASDECGRDDDCPSWHWQSIPTFSTSWQSVLALRDYVKTWLFGRRSDFKKALQRRVSDRSHPGLLLHADEIVFYVEPIDICRAALDVLDKLP